MTAETQARRASPAGTTERQAAVLRLRAEGRSIKQIADELDVEMATVSRLLARARREGALPASKNPPGRPWTEAETARLQADFAGEVPFRTIAGAIGRTEEACRWKAKELGLRRARQSCGVTAGMAGKAALAPSREAKRQVASRAIAAVPPERRKPVVTGRMTLPADLPADAAPVALIEAGARQCRWMPGGAAETTCCGAPTEPGESWCAHHRARVWTARRAA